MTKQAAVALALALALGLVVAPGASADLSTTDSTDEICVDGTCIERPPLDGTCDDPGCLPGSNGPW